MIKQCLKLAGFCSSLCLSLIVSADEHPNQLSVVEKADGWKLLFDGKTLAGWRGYKSEQIADQWKIIDGALTLTAGKAGDVMTVEEFGDFEIAFEWKISSGGNSGVIYRVGLGEAASYKTGPEYQILDNENAKDNKLENHLAGSLYDIGAGVARDAAKPAGEWNSSRIVVKGWNVEHWLNGKQLVSLDLISEKGKSALQNSKFKDWPKFASLKKGHIAFQDHGDVVAYRSIRIRELK
jgi:hypothetical protein